MTKIWYTYCVLYLFENIPNFVPNVTGMFSLCQIESIKTGLGLKTIFEVRSSEYIAQSCFHYNGMRFFRSLLVLLSRCLKGISVGGSLKSIPRYLLQALHCVECFFLYLKIESQIRKMEWSSVINGVTILIGSRAILRFK